MSVMSLSCIHESLIIIIATFCCFILKDQVEYFHVKPSFNSLFTIHDDDTNNVCDEFLVLWNLNDAMVSIKR